MIKNKFLNYGDYKVKCVIGKRGISSFKKKETLLHQEGNLKLKVYFIEKIESRDLKQN